MNISIIKNDTIQWDFHSDFNVKYKLLLCIFFNQGPIIKGPAAPGPKSKMDFVFM